MTRCPCQYFTKHLLGAAGILVRVASWLTQAGHAQFAGEKTEAQEGTSLACGLRDLNPGPFASRAQDLNNYPSL